MTQYHRKESKRNAVFYSLWGEPNHLVPSQYIWNIWCTWLVRKSIVINHQNQLRDKMPLQLVPSRDQPSVLTLARDMVHPSYGKLKKPSPKFHRAWQWNVLDIDHIHYAAMDGYLCFNIYKGWMKSNNQVGGSSKEVLTRGRGTRTKSRTWTRTLSKVAVSLLMVVLIQCLPD